MVGGSIREDQVAFLAGVLTGLANTNNRVGWIGEAETSRGAIYRNGFSHGVRFACPLCLIYPRELAADASPEAGAAAASSLLLKYVDTASAIPGSAGDEALRELAGRSVRIAGAQPDFVEKVFGGGRGTGAGSVLGSIGFWPGRILDAVLPRFMAGSPPSGPIPYSIETDGLGYQPFQTPWITPGLQRNLTEMLDQIRSGQLDIGVDPTTGAEK